MDRLQTIKNYNLAKDDDQKSLLLPFIINHSWCGILFHNHEGNIVYRESNIESKIVPGYLDEANLSLDMYLKEIDRVSNLFNSNKVIFKSGDFQQVISNAKRNDFVALNPPYPENKNAQSDNAGMYVELYSHETLYDKLVYSIQELENKGVHYFMTYGFYNPSMKKFIIRDDSNQLRHFFRILGYENCAFGIALDQMYFSSKFLIPKYLKSTIIPASHVLENQEMTIEEAMKNFLRLQIAYKKVFS
jgi:site-specific DNA-adenine methylase